MLLILLSTISVSVIANESADEIALLREQIQLLSKRLDQIENKSKAHIEAKNLTTEKLAEKETSQESLEQNWADKVGFKSDFRYRYEYIDHQTLEIRQRNRVRLRAQFNMEVNKNLDFTLGIATGADDPVSSNQSFDSAFSTKDLRLDLAYFNWQLNDEYTLIGGKMNNPFYRPTKNPILWDGDLNPEGLALIYDNDYIHISLVGYQVEERKAADDTLLFGGQMTHTIKVSDTSNIITGFGYYDYQDIKGKQPLFDGNPKGNTLDTNGNYATDFNTAEFFAEYKTKLSGQPLSVYTNYYKNTKADNLDTAYTAGFLYGKVKDNGSWSIGLAYLDVEADAVIGLFNDSDFANGYTDSKGLLLKAGYGLQKNMSLGLTYIDSEIGQSQLSQTDYDRLQLDYIIKFK